jgi:hypothetical protein
MRNQHRKGSRRKFMEQLALVRRWKFWIYGISKHESSYSETGGLGLTPDFDQIQSQIILAW